MGLSLSNVSISSPPAAALLKAYRPAVQLTNSSSVVAYITGTLKIVNQTTGRTEYSSQLVCNPVEPGKEAIATALDDWTPNQGTSYTASAQLFYGNALSTAQASADPITITTPGTTPAPSTRPSIKLNTPGSKPIYILFEEDEEPVIQYPFYLNF
jgi:hypothetical protein